MDPCDVFTVWCNDVWIVRYHASITYLCHMYLTTTFKILNIEYRLIYWISEFFLLPNIVISIDPKIPYRSGPTQNTQKCNHTNNIFLLLIKKRNKQPLKLIKE